MARRPSVRYWNSRSAYCTTIQGKQILLAEGEEDFPDGPCYTAALRRFSELSTGKAKGVLLEEVVSKYLDWTTVHLAAATASIRRDRLKPFTAALGQTSVSDLTVYTIESWCDRQTASRGWSPSTVRLTLTSVSACLNWAAAKGVIPSGTVWKFDKPSEESRGLECVLSPEQERLVIETATGSTREFVQCLRDLGCRPSELTRATASHYDPSINALVYQANARTGQKKHKTARTGKPRVIYLTGEATAIIQRLIVKHPVGPLFRTGKNKHKGEHRGERWGWDAKGVVDIFIRLREKTNIRGLIPYSFRHGFAVRWLRAGKPAHILAEVMGCSVSILSRHYGHLCSQHDILRNWVDE